jgi:hypothetical protein
MLTIDSITFGKYNNQHVSAMLKDRSYCEWLLQQDWFQKNYEYLYNKVNSYDPKDYFLQIKVVNGTTFIENYKYFNLVTLENLKLPLNQSEKICYTYYLDILQNIKDSIYTRLENEEDNPYDIKTPQNWLQEFEKTYAIPRIEFKNFLNAYELPNITTIIEEIKKEGGIEYKGAKSFIIAKQKSLEQETWWENVLKNKMGEDIGTQFKYKNCIFDFVNINKNIIYECKLGLKDFLDSQHKKYQLALDKYCIIYLISRDCIINMNTKTIKSTNKQVYLDYISNIASIKKPSYLDLLLPEFTVIEVEKIEDEIVIDN